MEYTSKYIASLTAKVARLEAELKEAAAFERACYKSSFNGEETVVCFAGVEYVLDRNDYYEAYAETIDASYALRDAQEELKYAQAWAKVNVPASEFYEIQNRVRVVKKAA